VNRVILALALSVSLFGCAATETQVKKDLVAAVECAKVDPVNASLIAAAKTCILDVAAGQEKECLAQVAPLASWSTDEIQCIASKTGGK
jgi:hypothetical protein